MAATHRAEQEMMRANSKIADKGPGETNESRIEHIRAVCLARGANGIKGISRQFKIIDDDGSKSIDFAEFKKGLSDFGIRYDDPADYRKAFEIFDEDGSGTIDFDEFIRKLRPPLSNLRIGLIRKAFQKLDTDQSGVLTYQDLEKTYDVRKHPKYMHGEWSKEDVLKSFLKTFEKGGNEDGEVTWDEFLNYYSGVSASVDNVTEKGTGKSDAYFSLMMKQAWGI